MAAALIQLRVITLGNIPTAGVNTRFDPPLRCNPPDPASGARARGGEPLVLSVGSPRSHCNATPCRAMAAHSFKRRGQVIVGGHDHADVTRAVDRKPDEIHGQGNVDTLFLRPALKITELALDDCGSVRAPALALRSMSGASPPVPCRLRPS